MDHLVCLWAGLLLDSLGRQVWCLGQKVERLGVWVNGDQLGVWVHDGSLGQAWCLSLALMGLGPGSVWADLDLGSTGANQVPRTSGWAHHLNLYGAYLVLGWTGSLIS